jgi:hypothetical protein
MFAIQNSRIQTFIIRKITKQLAHQLDTEISIGKVNIAFFNKVILNDVLIEGQNRDTLFYAEQMSAKIDSLNLKNNQIAIQEFKFENSNINIESDSSNHFNFSFILDSLQAEKDTSVFWKINCNQFNFKNSTISYNNLISSKIDDVFIQNLDLNISEFETFTDSLQFKINSLTFNDGKNIFLNQFSANIIASHNEVNINELNLKSKYSEINNSAISFLLNKNESNKKPQFEFRLNNSRISLLEIAELNPVLKGMNQSVYMSGRIYGNLDDLKGKNVILRTGNNTQAVLDFYINGIMNPETMYLFFDLKQAKTTFSDISNLKLPNKFSLDKLVFPDSFYDAGNLSFNGNFSGFLTDFVTFGTLESEMGTITTDLSVIPEKEGITRYRGNVATVDFNIGQLLQKSLLGNITFDGKVDGNFNKTNQNFSGFFKGDISEIEANSYIYKNIKLEGLLSEKMFDGLVSVNDSNLKFAFLGQFDLNPKIPVFDFSLKLDNFLPGNLNLSKSFPAAQMAFDMNANFTGNKLDNLIGSIVFNDGIYKNRNGEFDFKDVKLIAVPNDSTETLTFTSDFFDINVSGKYDFQSFLNNLKKGIQKFFPAIHYTLQENEKLNVFNYQVTVHNLDELTKVFAPELKFETPFLLYGEVDSENLDYQLAGSIPSFIYKNILVRNVFLNNKTIDNQYSSMLRFGQVDHKNGYSIYDLSVESFAAGNILDNEIHWNNNPDSTSSSVVKVRSFFTSDSTNNLTIEANGFPSDLYIADTLWNFNPFTAVLNSGTFSINNFRISNKQQSFSVNGNISKNKPDLLSMEFKNLNLRYLEEYLEKDIFLDGILNGSVGVTGIYDQPAILSDITIDSLKYKNRLVGEITLSNKWDRINSVINSELIINKDNQQSLNANGFYRPKTKELDYLLRADNFSLELLETVIRGNFTDIHGEASGEIKVGGTFDRIELDGAILANNGGLTIDYTKVHYNFNDFVYFNSDTILFNDITMLDAHNNSANINGTLKHRNFRDMVYDLTINSPKILAFNTTIVDNELFYGQAFGDGKFRITGKGNSVNLSGTATTLSGTNLNISMEYENEIEQYDFIKFVTKEKTETEKLFFEKDDGGGISINLTIEATPDAKIQLIYNSQIGDIIKAQGEGILLFEMDKEYNIALSGDFRVIEGDYLFTLQNVLNKRFTIEQGGSIVWSGDPYNAIIDLTATYKLKAAIYDLMMESYLIQGEDIYQRIPVECKILLTEELTNPLINFEIDFPDEDEALIGILQQFINTEEEMNKQILSLIVLGKFYTPEYLRGQYETQNPNTLGTTASEMFSNQLSNWLSKISSNVDVGFNYRPGNQITNDEIELALSTQIFNDRVILNGNIGNNINPESSNSSQIVGDFDMKVKLVPSGKIQFKAFNRSNNNLIYETAPYTQGIGLSFKEEYNTFNELLQKIGSLFKKKKH